VVNAVQDFFVEKYKTEVKVHNIVSAVDGVSVFVESIGEPHFYTFAIVPVDVESGEVETNRVWSQEGQVEDAIQGGLYAMAYEEEFSNLDAYLEGVTNEYPVVGTPMEAIENVKGNGYTTPYYFISTFDDVFDDLLDVYLENPKLTKQEIRRFFKENPFESNYLAIGIEFYMKDADVEPDQNILNKIAEDLKQMEGIPRGEYSLALNDNYIDKKRGIGKKDNTLRKATPDTIIKE